MFTVQLVWNREFNWSNFKSLDDLGDAKELADLMINSGDGARVKKVRVIDENENVLYSR